ncbi:MAG: helix-turn-helix transcriptional regulator [Planctomycetes bacterium]|nr:helix-turn-helix transcriptional regulator [Planctomycetota bacterium]
MKTTQINENIREVRLQMGMSLNELAIRSGFSKGYLSKLENGHAQAPIATLMRIAKSLDCTINQLFDGKDDGPSFQPQQEAILTKRAHRELNPNSKERGYSFERLALGSSFRLSPYIIHLDDDDAPTKSYQHGGEEIIYMLAGSCKYRVGDQIHDLTTGDTLIFDAQLEHGPIKTPGVLASYFAVFDEH